MASMSTVRLTKGDSPNWGFRLQGGKDFGTPLVIQKVNGGSPAERAGLIAGDAVIKINNVDVYNRLHKEAQDVIVRAGSSFEMVIQRGGSTWKPSVIPTGTYSKPSPSINNVSPVTKTSLAAQKGENIGAIGTGHNLAAKPFSPQVNGAVNGAPPKLVNKQYNSPLKLYSEDAIAETISAQSEVLSTGALGVNFKKNEKDYDATNSAVYRMLKEAENDAPSNEPVTRSEYYATHSHAIGSAKSPSQVASERLVSQQEPVSESATICTDCERVIIGVFVRIKDKNLHVECFKCATCGSSLKNVGYYNINNKLYCDIHAKSAAIAINNPAAVPIIPAGVKAPVSAISSALSGHSLPSPSPLSPKTPSFAPSYPPPQERPDLGSVVGDVAPQTPNQTHDSNPKSSSNSSLYNPSAPVSFSKFINKPSTFGGPKPFSSVSAPLSPGGALNRGAPLSPPSNFNKAPLSPPIGHSKSPYSPAPSGRAPALNSAGALFRGAGAGRQAGGVTATPKRGRGLVNAAALPGSRVPLCGHCHGQIRGPFITALGKIWCPQHFTCNTPSCKRPLQDLGFVEEQGQLYCEYCFEQYLAPPCSKCNGKIKGDCLRAIGKNFHPECFNCVYCGKLFGNNPFFLEDGNPYCDADWNELFTTKCFACGFPVEAGDRWVEALNNNYHSQCFNCTMCKKNLEGQSFFAKGGRPFCKTHAR
uniref:PDZ and LIM domain protein Zasp n=1 Tax=Dendroctonus ponderosae TaxID=77166 RepID=A0AAR5PL69_DENPD